VGGGGGGGGDRRQQFRLLFRGQKRCGEFKRLVWHENRLGGGVGVEGGGLQSHGMHCHL
jgi:hypothetical protein